MNGLGISLPGSGKHWRAMVNTAAGDRQTVGAERALGVPSSLGCFPNFYLPEPHARRSGHHLIARKLPGDSTTTSFRLGSC